MIHNPYLLITILLAVESGIIYLATNPRSKHLFKFIPSMFWIYFVPMLLSTFGLIDAKSSVYAAISKNLLPPALFLLLINMDIKAISRLGPAALIMFFSGSVGIVLGIVVSFLVFKPLVGPQFWSGFGALAASWTGGSANMIAVKESLNTPDAVFLPMVIVDTIVPYSWMGILVALQSRQVLFDRWNNADRRILDDLERRTETLSTQKEADVDPGKAIVLIALALIMGRAAQLAATCLPTFNGIVSAYAWSIILISTAAIMLSLTKISQVPHTGAHRHGKWILYFVLTSIGARASLSHASEAGLLVLAGMLVLIIHVLVLLLAARIIRAPLFLVATASLSNIAGLVSAPVIAEVYQPGFASVGLLLAILGHSLGAYIGIATGELCRFFAH